MSPRKAKPSFGPWLAGVQVVRCQAQPSSFDEDAIHWSIEGLPFSDTGSNSEAALGLFGELFVHTSEASVAVTVQGFLDYGRGGDASALFDDDRDRALEAFKPIAAHYGEALWDIAADQARVLAATTRLEISVPLKSPEPDAITIVRSPEEFEADARAAEEAAEEETAAGASPA